MSIYLLNPPVQKSSIRRGGFFAAPCEKINSYAIKPARTQNVYINSDNRRFDRIDGVS
ncbi:hypothetical protein [Scytonema millei]|uniref:Uncharacterized protein n=1 Tax=Scytonema millei VB511283 TaxID=1245923 RepID=A0A9X5E4U1_9CYAN|nr:hypothetical protein [Scytonema millei]NHC34928.1 hypothetical protein [Scytonema millei VB511283]